MTIVFVVASADSRERAFCPPENAKNVSSFHAVTPMRTDCSKSCVHLPVLLSGTLFICRQHPSS